MLPTTRRTNVPDRHRAKSEIWTPSNTEALLYELLGSSLVLSEDWDRPAPGERERLLHLPDRDGALSEMVECGLLTPYQAARIGTGNTFGLVLGNFRILDRIGAGGMAVVYKAEHLEMRHTVAIKVLHLSRGDDPRLESRFSAPRCAPSPGCGTRTSWRPWTPAGRTVPTRTARCCGIW